MAASSTEKSEPHSGSCCIVMPKGRGCVRRHRGRRRLQQLELKRIETTLRGRPWRPRRFSREEMSARGQLAAALIRLPGDERTQLSDASFNGKSSFTQRDPHPEHARSRITNTSDGSEPPDPVVRNLTSPPPFCFRPLEYHACGGN